MRSKISISEIGQKSPRQIIDDISNTRYSLLKSLGCGIYDVAYFWVRWACLFFLNMSERHARKISNLDRTHALKYSLSRIFEAGAPSYISDAPGFPKTDCGFIIGFNHPSLGEVIRLMGICMRNYPDNRYLFPVNIIWYEALAPVIDRLAEYDFYITPIITPSAKKALLKHCKDPQASAQIDRLARGFSDIYLHDCVKFVEDRQITLVAPSARRQDYIFETVEASLGSELIEPQTMTILALSLLRKKIDFAFLPVAVIPPEDASRGLNLLSAYKILPCTAISPQMTMHKCKEREVDCNSRQFERYFLDMIARKLREYGAGDKIIRSDR